ncbi:MAG: tyrosine-type recombinase/integrase [Candidatus Aenigmarchaeota archaeon]|nr:tyrosine-type recombinase/integrase [Candidatus Aenigmarchaeota archaeon]
MMSQYYDDESNSALDRDSETGRLYDEMCSRGFRPKTKKTYLSVFRRYRKFAGTAISETGSADVKRYLTLLNKRGASNTSLNLILSALKFAFGFYGKNLDIRRPRKEKKMPAVLSRQEVKRIVGALENPKHRLMLRCIYGLGLRISELQNLKVRDIDFDRKVVRIENSKGARDRIVPLPASLTADLKSFISLEGGTYIFHGRNGKVSLKTIQKVFEKALKKSGIKKKASAHTLRHSYATHLLENGTDIRIIQKLLGHSKLETTQIYTHVAGTTLERVKSPLDEL